MIFTTFIPTHLNDGSPVARADLDALLDALVDRFGGATIEGLVTGHWIDHRDGRHYVDRSLKVSVVFSADRIAEAEEAVKAIGRRLKQEAMYFELRDSDVRFLRD